MKRAIEVMLRAIVCLAAAWGAGGALAAGNKDGAPADGPCRVPGVRHEAICGTVSRPLDGTKPEGTHIDVHYVVIGAMARNKSPDPVFFFAGGPGQSAISLAGQVMPLFSRLSNRRDIVFVDQRGTGWSAPLMCEDDAQQPLAQRLDVESLVRRMARCREQLAKLPWGDLRQFGTTQAMGDVDAVRQALGAQQVNLVGVSYGTRAALEYQRLFPRAVRRMVLDGVAPPDMVLPLSFAIDNQAALDAWLDACEHDDACRARRPQLRARWNALLASLPRTLDVVDPVSGEPERITLTRDALASLLRTPLYAPSYAQALPFAMAEAASGRFTPLLGLASALSAPRAMQPAEGMHFSVVCAEDVPLMERQGASANPAAFADLFAQQYRRVCADWPRASVSQGFYEIGRSAAPVLLFSGGLDPATPPRHGERVAHALGEKARHVVVPNAGHGVMGIGCGRDIVHRFIDVEDDAQALAVDAACLAKIPRPDPFDPPRPAAGANQGAR